MTIFKSKLYNFLICTCRIKILKYLINVTVAICSTLLTNYIYKYLNKERNEAIFFYGSQPSCHYHYGKQTTVNMFKNSECSTCKLNTLIGWLNESKKTMDICMYTLSHNLLSNAVINAYKRGVCVRVILDNDSYVTWNMSIAGIAKKVKKQEYFKMLMHHKFIIIDNNKIILGSLNWTISGVRNNWENLFISNDCKIVDPFRDEFHRLWAQFD